MILDSGLWILIWIMVSDSAHWILESGIWGLDHRAGRSVGERPRAGMIAPRRVCLAKEESDVAESRYGWLGWGRATLMSKIYVSMSQCINVEKPPGP